MIAAAIVFMTGFATASAEVEDIRRPAPLFPDGGDSQGVGLFPQDHVFGHDWTTPVSWTGTPRDTVTPDGQGGRFFSSRESDIGTPPEDQGGAGPDYDLNADYSSSTLEGGHFPTAVTDFGSVELLFQSGWMLFGDGDQAAGFNFAAPGYWSAASSSFDLFSEGPTGKRRSARCSSDDSSTSAVHCEIGEDLGSFATTSSGAGPETGYQFGQNGSNPPGSSPHIGGGSLSAGQILDFEMMAAQYGFATTWPWGAIQETFPPECDACDAAPPVPAPAPLTSDFIGPDTNLNSDPPVPLGTSTGTPLPAAVPEIPSWAMLLSGFAGLALLGRVRLRRLARLRNDSAEPGRN